MRGYVHNERTGAWKKYMKASLAVKANGDALKKHEKTACANQDGNAELMSLTVN